MMATSSKIKIMISSRCNDRFPLSDTSARDLSEIRKQLKSEIENLWVFGRAIYEVWINELETEDAAKDAWAAKFSDHALMYFEVQKVWAARGRARILPSPEPRFGVAVQNVQKVPAITIAENQRKH